MLDKHEGGLGFWAVFAIGVGGMVGGGIFAVLGLSVNLAHGGAPLAFLIAGLVALVTAYSYARLSVTFPSQGGTVTFLDQAFGSGLLTGSLNILLWISYMVMLSLYAYAFGSYGASLFPESMREVGSHVLISAAVLAITGLNLLSAKVVGASERWIVLFKVLILLVFIVVGFGGVDAAQVEPAHWAPLPQLIAGGMIIFLAYEGFELIANTASDVRNPGKILPRAYFSSVGFVILLYVLIAIITVGTLPVAEIVAAKDYALAEVARPSLGQAGFVLIAVTAMLSTASAMNATVYGAARLSYVIAKDGELPDSLEHYVWGQPIEGLLITSAVTLVLANVADLSSISVMGSAGFLLIFAAVNAANVRMAAQTASRAWLSASGAVLCLTALGVLIWQTVQEAPGAIGVLIGMLVLAVSIEALFRWTIRDQPRLNP